ncbi:MAG: PAS domain S-box protein [Deltaproteobacteria bacterium]|nr:PAS domain S-box protein [Deltaproteobacteria bacterium]
MIKKPTSRRYKGIKPSPWIVVGSAIILLVIVIVLAVQSISGERQYMSRVLSEKGAALIRSFEAGARHGMMSMMWGGNQLQRLLEETARQEDIIYLIVTDNTGVILAHNDRSRIGENFADTSSMSTLNPGEQELWRLTDTGTGQRVFEVYRNFRPLADEGRSRGRGRMSMMMKDRRDDRMPSLGSEPNGRVIFVGLDVRPIEDARREDIRNTIIISAVLVLLGLGGIISLYWAQSYRSTRRSLQDTSAFADEVVTNLPVGLIAMDRDGKIASINAAAEEITGISLDDALGKDPKELLPSELCGLKDSMDQGHVMFERDMECGFSDGDPVPLSVSGTNIINEEGDHVGSVIILRDLGEVRRLQDEIRRKEKLAALGGLAAGVAHEIRNPLSSIKGMASYFGSKFKDGSEDREAAIVMAREVDRLDRVISELLYFARPSELKLKPVDINELLEHSVRLVRQDAETKGVKVDWSGSQDLPRVSIDPDRFSQCLLNLHLNAIQAMGEGGVLTIRSLRGENREIKVEISDTGKGIDPDDLKRIFDPYFTTKPSGTGLGLAIVHKIIEAHQGRIEVDSVPDNLCTGLFRLIS